MLGKIIHVADKCNAIFLSPIFNIGADVYVHAKGLEPQLQPEQLHANIGSIYNFNVKQRKIGYTGTHIEGNLQNQTTAQELLDYNIDNHIHHSRRPFNLFPDNKYWLYTPKATRVEFNQVPWALIKQIKKTGIIVHDFKLTYLNDNFDPTLKYVLTFILDNIKYISVLQWFWKQGNTNSASILLKENLSEELRLTVHSFAELLRKYEYISHFEYEPDTFKYTVTFIKKRYLILKKNLFDKYTFILNIIDATISKLFNLMGVQYESLMNVALFDPLEHEILSVGIAFYFKGELFYIFYDSTDKGEPYTHYAALKESMVPINFIWVATSPKCKTDTIELFYTLQENGKTSSNVTFMITRIEDFIVDFFLNFITTGISNIDINNRQNIPPIITDIFINALLKVIPHQLTEPQHPTGIQDQVKDEMLDALIAAGIENSMDIKGIPNLNELIAYLKQEFTKRFTPSKRIVNYMLQIGLHVQLFLNKDGVPIKLFSEDFYSLASYDAMVISNLYKANKRVPKTLSTTECQ